MTDVELDARVTALEENAGTDPTSGKLCLFTLLHNNSLFGSTHYMV